MYKISKFTAKLVVIFALVSLCALSVVSAWATVAFIHQTEKSTSHGVNIQLSTYGTHLAEGKLAEEIKPVPRSRAPEPSTMMLFGGGFIGMVASFIRRTYVVTKRFFDVAASLCGFIVLAPLFLVAALLVKLTSKGPVIYSQERVGKDGELFNIYKFRTMKVDAEKETGPVWAMAKDSRLTPVGSLLRKTHIDEIPQLVNILRGEMSLIGPRPERPCFVEKFNEVIPDYHKRLTVKPGITGLAQVWHRYDESVDDVKKKIKYDLLYIKKICLWADLNILMRTFRVVVTGEGAR